MRVVEPVGVDRPRKPGEVLVDEASKTYHLYPGDVLSFDMHVPSEEEITNNNDFFNADIAPSRVVLEIVKKTYMQARKESE